MQLFHYVHEAERLVARADNMLRSCLQAAGHDVAPVFARLVHAMGDRQMTAGDASRFYNGSNKSYALDALDRGGYITRTTGRLDKRCVLVQRTEKGRRLAAVVDRAFARAGARWQDTQGLYSCGLTSARKEIEDEANWVYAATQGSGA